MDLKTRRVLYASNAYERVWGRPVKWLYEGATSWLSSIHPDERDRVERAVSGCLNSGGFRVEYRIVRPDGTQRWIRDRGFLVRDADGQVSRIAGIAEDVTEQKSIEDKLRLERKLLKRLLDLQSASGACWPTKSMMDSFRTSSARKCCSNQCSLR